MFAWIWKLLFGKFAEENQEKIFDALMRLIEVLIRSFYDNYQKKQNQNQSQDEDESTATKSQC